MAKSSSLFIVVGMLLAVGLGATAEAASTEHVPRMTQKQAKSMLGNPELIIIDVRQPRDWNASSTKIKGAIREEPSNAAAWASKYPKDKTLLFYCA
jgi:rhodanese-related sulfurtransferase